MKVLLVAVTCLTLVSVKAHHEHFSQADKAKIYRLHEECKTQTGIDDKLILQAETAQQIEDPKMRQYILCFSKKIGFQNEEGVFQKDVIKTKLSKYSHDQERIDRIVANCTVQKETAEDSAAAYFLCHRDNSPDYKDFFFYVANITTEQHEKLKQHKEVCMKETGLQQEILTQIEQGNFPDDENFKRFALCVSKRIGAQNADGKIDEKLAREKLTLVIKDEDKVDNVIKLCLKDLENPEETAVQMLKCIKKKLYFNLLACPDVPQEDDIQKARKYNEACKPVSGILPEELEEAKKGIILESDTFKKHLFCIYRKCEIIDEKGVLIKEKLYEGYGKRVEKEKVDKVYQACHIDNDTPENNSFKMFKCFIENISSKANFFTFI